LALSINATSWWGCHDTGSGGNASDDVGAATLTNTRVDSTAGVIGQAAYFAPNGLGSLSRSDLVVSAAPLSFCCWAMLSAIADHGLLGQFATLGTTELERQLLFAADDGTLGFGAATGGTYAAGVPIHLVGTNDGATSKLYVNSVLVASAAEVMLFAGTSPTMVIGRRRQQGQLDEKWVQLAGIFAGVLTDGGASVGQAAAAGSDVALLYNRGGGLDYPFDIEADREGDIVIASLSVSARVTATLSVAPRVTATLSIENDA